MTCVLQEGPHSLNILAPDCSSWCIVSRGTSLRSPINVEGRSACEFVARGNLTISRLGPFGISGVAHG